MRIRGENAGVSNGVVAIVDYDSAMRDSLIFLLETAGYRVEAYDSALRFLAEPGWQWLGGCVAEARWFPYCFLPRLRRRKSCNERTN